MGLYLLALLTAITLFGITAGTIGLLANKLGKHMGSPGWMRIIASIMITLTVFCWMMFIVPGPQLASLIMGIPMDAERPWILNGATLEDVFRPRFPVARKPASGLPAAATAEAAAEAEVLAEEPTTGPKAKCKQLKPLEHPATREQQWHLKVPEGEWWILEVHSNHWDPNLDDHKMLLEPGESATFMSGGGKIWPYSCASLAKANYRDKEMPPIDQTGYDEYIAAP